jgi:hypothetical protein
MKVLPMGWSYSVWLVQRQVVAEVTRVCCILTTLLNVSFSVNPVPAVPVRPGHVVILVYVDDMMVLASSHQLASLIMRILIDVFNSAGYVVKLSKCTETPSELLGIRTEDGRLFVDPVKICRLLTDIASLIVSPQQTAMADQVRSLNGRLTWLSLLNRSSLSLLSQTYRFENARDNKLSGIMELGCQRTIGQPTWSSLSANVSYHTFRHASSV